MELIRGLANLKPAHRGCVLSIGNYDGVHRGHQALLRRVQALAAEYRAPSMLMNFHPTAKEFFTPEAAPPRVSTLRDKIALLDAAGVERLLLVRFCTHFSRQSPTAFVDELLLDTLEVRAVVVGDDFRFGYRRSGDVAGLQRLGAQRGFRVESVGAVDVAGLRCSSTAIRSALAAGDLAAAERMLGRRYGLRGCVRRGQRLGRTLGTPTANLSFKHEMALRYGVYAVRGTVGGHTWDGVANFGVRPTVGFSRCLLEVHLFADAGDLYGRELAVEFHRFLRPEQRFPSIDALAAQIRRDAEAARHYFADAV